MLCKLWKSQQYRKAAYIHDCQFEGVVIKRQNGGIRETFTVRRIASGVGVERTWPLHSPRIDRIEVVRRGIVRRAKLFYLRDKVGKAAKVKEVLR